MKIDTKLKVIAAEVLEKAIAAELETKDGDIELLLAQQKKESEGPGDEREDAEDNTESV